MLDGGASDPQRQRRYWGVEATAKTCNCKLQPNRQSYAATWGEYKRGVGWTCHRDSDLSQITVVHVINILWVGGLAYSGNTFYSINEVTLRRAGLVLGWVTACGQVIDLSI